ncbi:MAG: Nudix family hydrolase [Gammaproteobacteria bacterium]|nr:Nudix family hydrolase [Gammaproteobacteria bacterium]
MKRIDIVLGVIRNPTGDKVLIARRPQGSHLGGLWEFPGGKVRNGEAALDALKRELYEEVNIKVADCSPLISFNYDYPDRLLRFRIWKICRWTGEVTGKEGQEMRWADTDSLSAQDFPPANRGVISACRLPGIYLITPDLDSYPPAFMNELDGYLAAGVKLVQFRSKSAHDHKSVVMEMIAACRRHGAWLMVNSTPEFAMEVGAAGVHLTSARLLQLTERPLPAAFRVAVSCHNPEELNHAVRVGVDFCVLSPVRKPSGKPGIPLGWDRFSGMISHVPVPVYALGGMKLSDVNTARRHGAQGTALISDVWDRPDATARLKQYLG